MKRFLVMMSCAVFLSALVQCGKGDKPAPDTKKTETRIELRYVTAKGGLRMREKPDTGAAVIDTVPEGEAVELLEETGSDVTISGATGKWSRIKWKEKSGWGFGGFLTSRSSAAGGALPDDMLKGYYNTGPVEPGNAPGRITLAKSVIARYYGGSMTSHSYCIVGSVAVSGNRFTVTCADRTPSAAEAREFFLEQGAQREKTIVIVREGANIRIGADLYKPGSGL